MNGVKQKVYILQKELPILRAGAEFVYNNGDYHCFAQYLNESECYSIAHYPPKDVENNPEWFKEKQQPIVEERIVVTNIQPTKGSNELKVYISGQVDKIPESRYQIIMNAIGWVLNDEKIIESIPTIERQDSKEDKTDWEILTFINQNIITDVPNGNVEKYNNYAVLKDYHIHSVKRLSDNEVFTIGDEVMENITGRCESWEIKEFTTKDTRCFAEGVNILNIKKAPKEEQKPILFTTEDGVHRYDGDDCYIVQLPNLVYIKWTKICKEGMCDNYKYFSTKEAAEQYIMENKPCLSYQEIMNGLHAYMIEPNLASQTLKKLANTKINKQ